MKSEFLYDGMGRRVQRTDYSSWKGRAYRTANVTKYVWDGWLLLAEQTLSNDGGSTNSYVWGQDISGSLQGAGGVGGLLAVVSYTNSLQPTVYYPVYDGNGNITDYVDANGTVVAHREYDPFGRTVVSTGPMKDAFSFWFSTKYHEPFWNLYYYGYRYYSPELGRWLSRDPVGEIGGLNLYAFVRNDPIDNVDPYGLFKWKGRKIKLPTVICGPFDPPCCSKGKCITWAHDKGNKCRTLGSSACLSGCALICTITIGSGPGYFACYGACIINCEAAVLAGCTAGEAVCWALCLQCKQP